MNQSMKRLGDWIERRQTLVLGFGFLLAILLRLTRIGSWSIWFDESFTSSLIREDVSTGVEITAKDVHPPLYYVLLKGWSQLFGSSDFALRSFSALLSILAAYLLYRFIKQRLSNRAALAAFYAVALGPFGVRYAQEARMYTLTTVFVVIATWSFMRLMDDKRPRLIPAIIYSLSLTAALYTHYFVFPIVFAHLAYAYIYHHQGWLPRPSTIRAFINEKRLWIYSLLASAVLYAPWVPIAFKQFSNVANGFWIPKVTIMAPFNTFFFFLTNTSTDRIEFESSRAVANFTMIAAAVYLAVLALMTTMVYRTSAAARRRTIGLLALTSLVPVAVIFLLSVEPFQSLYIDRYFIYFGILWYALLGAMLVSKVPSFIAWLRWPMTAATLIWFTLGLSYLYRLGNFNYNTWQEYGSKEIMVRVNQDYRAGDAILTNDIFTFYDVHHYNQTPTAVLADTTKEGTNQTPYLRQFPNLLVNDKSTIRAGRVWYVTLAGDEPQVPDTWQLVGTPFISKHAKVSLYELAPKANP